MRLIDADELIKALDTWDKYGYDEQNRLVRIDNDDNEYVPYVHYEDVVNCIKCIQTAFDIDNVVQELEEIAERYTNEQECSCGGNEKKCDFYEYKRKGGAE